MECKNIFCIYEFQDKCSLDKISINSIGLCSSYIPVNIDKIRLTQAKDQHLQWEKDRKKYLGKL